MLGKVDLMA